jgi:hypothetical protein
MVVCHCCFTSKMFSLHSPRSAVRLTRGYDTRQLTHLGEVSPISFVIVFSLPFSTLFVLSKIFNIFIKINMDI